MPAASCCRIRRSACRGLNWADIHLRYHGAHIEGRNMPLDDLTVALDVVGGSIKVHPISFGVGKGRSDQPTST